MLAFVVDQVHLGAGGAEMPIIHVRSISEDLITLLRAKARGHFRSMEAEVRAILSEALQPPPVHGPVRHVNFDLIARTDLGDVTFDPVRPAFRELEL
jgi:plasmid stability protein